MIAKQDRWRPAVVLALALLAPGMALACPEDGWFWHRSRGCPHGDYSWLHYWAPGIYQVRAQTHPSNLDQYPPGPSPSVAPSYDFNRYKCRSIPSTPSDPYADPTAYFGRPIAPP